MSWLYSRALVEGFLADGRLDGARFARSSSTPMPQAFLWRDKTTDAWSRFPSGMMCELLTADHGEELSRLCRAAFPVRTSAPQERGSGSVGSGAGCGKKWRALSVKFDRVSCGWKTVRCLWDEGLDWSLLTLPRWGSMHDGELWERTTQALRTEGRGSGLWPTPTKSDGGGGPGCSGRDGGENLRTRVAMWPTPTVACATGGQTSRSGSRKGELLLAGAVKMFPTPRAEDGQCSGGHRGKDDTLYGAICRPKQFPTPCATEARQGFQNRNNGKKGSQESLTTVVQGGPADKVGGSLNPTWVEWLMGWPLGWTCMEPLAVSAWVAWQEAFATGRRG